MLSIFPADRFTETRWRNGQGLAWEIASEPPGAAADNFDWRFAIARINGDAPFSHYPGIDRIFTLTAGNGVDLTVEGQGTLTVHERFVPHRFPGDAATSCHIDSG
ncbi:MAG: HutD family protein, partial [Rhizobiales bacterium]|nr:HutD family protein [Hyphomicrobiales bacterium]